MWSQQHHKTWNTENQTLVHFLLCLKFQHFFFVQTSKTYFWLKNEAYNRGVKGDATTPFTPQFSSDLQDLQLSLQKSSKCTNEQNWLLVIKNMHIYET